VSENVSELAWNLFVRILTIGKIRIRDKID
jgi:hypothetical protein